MSTESTADLFVDEQPPGLIRQAMKLRRTQIGVTLSLLLIAVALIGPFVAPFGSTEYVDMPNTLSVPGTLLGTDYFGQDVLSRFLFRGRTILILAVIATSIGITLGTTLGLSAAYLRGRYDEIIMRALDVILSFPQVLLSLVVISMFGPSNVLIICTVGLSTTPRIARIIRGAAISVVERDFISAAEALGETRKRVVFAEVLPNVTSSLLVEMNLRLTYSVGLIASLAFLGFTPEPNAANWGLMIQENRVALTEQPWGVVLPTIALALMTIGTGLVGAGLSRVSAGIDRGGKGE